MLTYKSFLAPPSTIVLPYFGGTRVDARERRLRVAPGIAPGWWRFQIDGRRAVPEEPAPPGALAALPAVRGHFADGWVVSSGRELGRIALPPDDEPAPLARVTARRWYSGELVLDTIDFEDEAEVAARRALETGGAIADVRGAAPSLRVAFALALGAAVAREVGVPISLRELAPHTVAIAAGGRAAVVAVLDALAEARRVAAAAARARVVEAQRAAAAEAVRAAEAAAHARARAVVESRIARDRRGSPADRADAALEGAGARMLSCRRIAQGAQLEVRFVVDDVRLTATVLTSTLQVLDAGICLAGADRELTLDSLPSVVREAIETDRLNITRHD